MINSLNDEQLSALSIFLDMSVRELFELPLVKISILVRKHAMRINEDILTGLKKTGSYRMLYDPEKDVIELADILSKSK